MRLSVLPSAALLSLIVAACAPPSAQEPSGARLAAPARSEPARTLVFIARSEPDSLASSGGIGTAAGTTRRFFTATLAMSDDQGTPLPYLAEALPALNTDSWRLLADGRMETTYRLRPNLTWHDGAPFTAQDLVFTWRALTTAELGQAGLPPQSAMEDVAAADARTAVITWKRPFPQAGTLADDLRPLPSHLLEALLQGGQPDAWENHAYWTRDFVGLGAFRLDRWEPGTFIEGTAFDGYAFGRPRIDRLRIIFSADPNTVLATLLSGGAHLVADTTIRFQTAGVLRREWEPRNAGTVILTPAYVRYVFAQFRPDVVNPRAITDLRVRKAIASAVDKPLLVEALFEGQGIVADALATPRMPHFAAADRTIAKYPYDPRRTEQYMAEAGFTRGPDGVYVSPSGERLAPEWRATSGGDSETQLTVIVDTVRRLGIDAHAYVLPQSIQDPQTRATFPSFLNWSTAGSSEDWLTNYVTAKIPGPDTRWSGNNRGGWANPEYDRLADTFSTTLDREERSRLAVQLLRFLSEELPVMPLYYNLDVVAHVASLYAPRLVAPDGSIGWNFQEWELR